ncbi:hypothetical protein Efla_001306 [Eimeria flavescens]
MGARDLEAPSPLPTRSEEETETAATELLLEPTELSSTGFSPEADQLLAAPAGGPLPAARRRARGSGFHAKFLLLAVLMASALAAALPHFKKPLVQPPQKPLAERKAEEALCLEETALQGRWATLKDLWGRAPPAVREAFTTHFLPAALGQQPAADESLLPFQRQMEGVLAARPSREQLTADSADVYRVQLHATAFLMSLAAIRLKGLNVLYDFANKRGGACPLLSLEASSSSPPLAAPAWVEQQPVTFYHFLSLVGHLSETAPPVQAADAAQTVPMCLARQLANALRVLDLAALHDRCFLQYVDVRFNNLQTEWELATDGTEASAELLLPRGDALNFDRVNEAVRRSRILRQSQPRLQEMLELLALDWSEEDARERLQELQDREAERLAARRQWKEAHTEVLSGSGDSTSAFSAEELLISLLWLPTPGPHTARLQGYFLHALAAAAELLPAGLLQQQPCTARNCSRPDSAYELQLLPTSAQGDSASRLAVGCSVILSASPLAFQAAAGNGMQTQRILKQEVFHLQWQGPLLGEVTDLDAVIAAAGRCSEPDEEDEKRKISLTTLSMAEIAASPCWQADGLQQLLWLRTRVAAAQGPRER